MWWKVETESDGKPTTVFKEAHNQRDLISRMHSPVNHCAQQTPVAGLSQPSSLSQYSPLEIVVKGAASLKTELCVSQSIF
jgi:hypothetical protein